MNFDELYWHAVNMLKMPHKEACEWARQTEEKETYDELLYDALGG